MAVTTSIAGFNVTAVVDTDSFCHLLISLQEELNIVHLP